jgi:hypothetical protein
MNQWLKTGSLRGKCPDTQMFSSSSQTVKSTSSPIASTSGESSISNEYSAKTSKPEKHIIPSAKKKGNMTKTI